LTPGIWAAEFAQRERRAVKKSALHIPICTAPDVLSFEYKFPRESRMIIEDGSHSFVIKSMPDGYCGLHALLQCCHSADDFTEMQALYSSIDGVVSGGITPERLTRLAGALGVPVMSVD